MSVSNDIRKNVGNLIKENKGGISDAATRLKSISSPKQKSLFMLKTATTYYSVSKDSNKFNNLHEESKEDIAALVKAYAALKGIKQDEKTKSPTLEQLNKELAPEELLKFAAASYLKETGAKNEEEERQAREEIKSKICEVYGDEGNENDPSHEAIQAVATIPPYKTDQEFLALDEEDRQKYLATQSPAEQARLLKAIENAAAAGKADVTSHDPDWPHRKNDDDFKIQDGDIIEYLFKDVILASTAWTANRIAGGVGALSYGTFSEIGRAVAKKRRERKKEKEEEEKKKEEEKKDDDKDGKEKAETTADSSTTTTSDGADDSSTSESSFDAKGYLSDTVDLLYNDSGTQKLQKDLDREWNKTAALLDYDHKLMRQLSIHYIYLGDDGHCVFGNPQIGEWQDKEIDPNSDEFKSLKQNQQNLTAHARDYIEQNTPEEQRKATLQVFDAYLVQMDEAVKNHSKEPPLPEQLKNNKLWKKAHNSAAERIKANKILTTMQLEAELFSRYYATYQLLAEYKKGPENDAFKEGHGIADLMLKKYKEATVAFWALQQQRKEDSAQKIPSNTALINHAKDQLDKATDSLNNNSSEPVPNIVSDLLKEKTPDQVKSLADEASQQVTVDKLLSLSKANIDAELRGLGGEKEANDERRKALNKRRGQFFSDETRKQNIGPLVSAGHSAGGGRD